MFKIIFSVISFIIICVFIAIILYDSSFPGNIDFYLYKNKYNKIISLIKTQHINNGEKKFYRLNSNLDPENIKERDINETINRGEENGLINVSRNNNKPVA